MVKREYISPIDALALVLYSELKILVFAPQLFEA
jgi:hypothetical protein